MIFGMDNFHLFTASSEMKCADGWMDGRRPKKGRKEGAFGDKSTENENGGA